MTDLRFSTYDSAKTHPNYDLIASSNVSSPYGVIVRDGVVHPATFEDYRRSESARRGVTPESIADFSFAAPLSQKAEPTTVVCYYENGFCKNGAGCPSGTSCKFISEGVYGHNYCACSF